jgi:DNA-binding response OmpR family regulator
MIIDGATILVLEDEPIIGLALEDMLVSKGATVVYASRMEEAHEALAQSEIDAAILDVNVHGRMSYPVAASLAELTIPFIFATGYGDSSHPPEFRTVPTIAKPYSAAELEAALTRASEGQRQ